MSSAGAGARRLRVLRIFHAGRIPAHRARDRALCAAGVDVTYVVPDAWPEAGAEADLSPEPFPVVEVRVRRAGSVNAHRYADVGAVARLAREWGVDLVDLCEEPFSWAAGQLLGRLPGDLPVVMYSAQNLDKRWPPPFGQFQRRSFRRAAAFYPCSRQAASVLRGNGFGGRIEPLPLGYDDALFRPGEQSLGHGPVRLALVGRMVPEKGVVDAVQVLARLQRLGIDARLVLAGAGPALAEALAVADDLSVARRVEAHPWLAPAELAALYRDTHLVLVPSRATATWVEQFGRVVVEAQASGCVVAGYDSGAIAEVAGSAAVLVDPSDVDALAAAAATVVGDEDAFQRRRQAGLAQSPPRTWAAVADRQAALYREALRHRTWPLVDAPPQDRRRRARAEFGFPAEALGQARPFALPPLAKPNAATRALGAAIDRLAERIERSS